ncbi:ROK family protein, partial [Escherichia coli]|uniref:ROK family protein n=1 Tax=Escherichia coli TaxID=562 RepID=UPI001E558308
VTSRNHNPGICQFADDFRWNHFRCQSHFGNHVGVLTQEIDQRKLRELIAISVILPGLVDPDSGKIHYMPHIQVENWGLVEAL